MAAHQRDGAVGQAAGRRRKWLIQLRTLIDKNRDLYNLLATIPGDQAFRPLGQSACPALRK